MPNISTMPTQPTRPMLEIGSLPTTPRTKKKTVEVLSTGEKSVPISIDVSKIADKKPQPVIYPKLKLEECSGANAITEDLADIILEWCTESQYQLKMVGRNPGTETGQYSYGDVFMLKDHEGNKVRCLNNLDNRPFDDGWCSKLEQTILNFQWAGEVTIRNEVEFVYGKQGMEPWISPDGTVYEVGDMIKLLAGTINGSSIGISRTGRVESGQHSLCALKRAGQKYRAMPRGTYPEWDEYLDKFGHLHQWGSYGPAPVIETILVTGLSENHDVLSSVDNCKPRTEADVFYTSDIFMKLRDYPSKRKELSRMLSACVSLFWKMTGRQGYSTHAEVMQLVLDHPKLVKAVEHLFQENADVRRTTSGKIIGGYVISNIGLSPGQCACLCYIMGCSETDGDEYRNGKPPKERGLNWSRWDQAKQFWSMIGESPEFAVVRKLLKKTIIEVDGVTVEINGSLAHKTRMTILAKAWEVWIDEGRTFTDEDTEDGECLHLEYLPASERLVDGKVIQEPLRLVDDTADFGGIDVGSTSGVPLSEEERERRIEEVRRERDAEEATQHNQARAEHNPVPVRPGNR